ncbi:SMP-30/gluconolactonase/LRE family protein, partial [Streptomyces cuspidosporus]
TQPLAFWDGSSSETRVLLEEFDGTPVGYVNDIEADARGSVWGGTVNLALPSTTEAARAIVAGLVAAPHAVGPAPSIVFRADPDGTVEKLWEEGTIANGLAFSPDGQRLYQCDTLTGVYAFDITADRRLANRQFFGKVPEGGNNGLAVDVEGGVWVAAVGGGSIIRFGPDAVIDEVIDVP